MPPFCEVHRKYGCEDCRREREARERAAAEAEQLIYEVLAELRLHGGPSAERVLAALVLDARAHARDYFQALKKLGVGTEPVPNWIE
jgi:phage-related baseplate assembly protein